MYQDYLDEREKYRRQLAKQQRQRQSLPQRKVRKSTSGANRYIQQSRNFRRQTDKQFNGLLLTARIIAGTLKGITRLMQTQVGMIMLGAAALLSVKNYIQKQGDKYSEEYAGEYGGSGISDGKLSEKGKKFIFQEEGLRTKAYQDSKGIWTIGVGHTGYVDGKKIGPGMEISEAKAKQLFEEDIKSREKYVNSVVKVPVTQNMFDAMVSYVFNVGSLGPKFLKKLNAKDYKGAMAELTTIDKELQGRRQREQKLFGSDISASNDLKTEAVNKEVVKVTDAGKIHRLSNGTMVGNYKMTNPVSHGGKYYIDLSERAETYLKETGGKGNVTSGAEGDTHKKGKIMAHAQGNKIDVTAIKDTNEEWADTAIPFLKNKNTAFVVFEDFTKARFEAIQKIIYSKIDEDLKKKCDSKCTYGWGDRGGKFLDYKANYGTGLHLDIGILPNAYSKNEYNQSKKNNAKDIPTKKEEPKPQPKQKGTVTGGAASITVDRTPSQEPEDYVNTGAVNMRKAKNSGQSTVNKTKKS